MNFTPSGGQQDKSCWTTCVCQSEEKISSSAFLLLLANSVSWAIVVDVALL